MSTALRYLMCAPSHYEVDYVINPWMEGNVHRSSREQAERQWQGLYQLLTSLAQVQLVEPAPGWPDMVFTANAGLVLDRNVVLSRFFHPERQGEEPYFRSWFEKQGYVVCELPEKIAFEGAGDALFDREGRWLWAGYGFRSSLESHPYLAKYLDSEVLSLRLVDGRFYHLDTCFCPLADGYLLYYPPAFDEISNRLIESRVHPDKRIVVGEADAVNFACNAVNVGRTVIVNQVTAGLAARLDSCGFAVRQTPLTEFLKAGGAAKCLTLRLTEPRTVELPQVQTTARTVELRGHLLDSALMTEVIDLIQKGGASFQIEDFKVGLRRQDTSYTRLRITAPSTDTLESVLTQLIDRGAALPEQAERDAELQPVNQQGVAPQDFYVTNIYPTEVRIAGQWVLAANQRMDGAIVVDPETASARCVLLRDVRVGDQVVCGVDGIRTRHQKARPDRSEREEFAFMASGVSSERRVELVVEQVAWQLRRLRQQGGKAVVVAGPVVIHTGGGLHLATLIREGYVQALLGGNAIAVHDIEQAFHGTSLGVDLQRGVVIQGGHRHHLKTINLIRGCGSIRQAVEQGVLRSGIFYECVRAGVPFSLAGSIRDDGPLPDTEMDLIEAQADYARLLKGAEMILMLSSMLHSIGVGNMTPAGVKMVCVDINPAVVTKLADRGSVESTGVVTDVGLFLSLLVRQLHYLGN
ncbi:TIGR00300 family protein [Gloeobacter kilaueensis]|uniref:ornithine cyclodeaminase n=1 Tax=Gloeobacter kilaueensis (strain ATCC BAA-2537 / CCAP 1431/1 / ULC 316 / JS1) TaxID=1183438 RepID=U5QEY1_GLOK1|nr:TIGR00300 family protein [Gloeobacter kilaueensis]AGY57476.1 lysine-ketoglutarate reductase/saccharopine dehydrogenase [Gloeobacter kilaueensis JS1]